MHRGQLQEAVAALEACIKVRRIGREGLEIPSTPEATASGETAIM